VRARVSSSGTWGSAAVLVEAFQGPGGGAFGRRRIDLAELLHLQPGGGHVAVGVANLQPGEESFPGSARSEVPVPGSYSHVAPAAK